MKADVIDRMVFSNVAVIGDNHFRVYLDGNYRGMIAETIYGWTVADADGNRHQLPSRQAAFDFAKAQLQMPA